MLVDWFTCWFCRLDSCQAATANAILPIAYNFFFFCLSCLSVPDSPCTECASVRHISDQYLLSRTRSLVVRLGNVGPFESAQPVMISVFISIVAYNTDHSK
jgi:hypothetical protein